MDSEAHRASVIGNAIEEYRLQEQLTEAEKLQDGLIELDGSRSITRNSMDLLQATDRHRGRKNWKIEKFTNFTNFYRVILKNTILNMKETG